MAILSWSLNTEICLRHVPVRRGSLDLDYSSDDWAELIRYYDEKHDGMYEEYCGMFTQVIFRECLE